MRPLSISWPETTVLALCAIMMPAGVLTGSGLENGEVQANAQFLSGGATVGREEQLSMEVQSPGSSQVPPPSNAAPSLARLDASMLSVSHQVTAGSNSALNQFNSAAQTLVEYVDSVVVNAEGVTAGTELILTVAWDVSGQSVFNAPDRIRTRSRLLLDLFPLRLDLHHMLLATVFLTAGANAVK